MREDWRGIYKRVFFFLSDGQSVNMERFSGY